MSRAAVEVSDLACRVHRQIALDEATFEAVVAHGDAVAGGPGLDRFVFENRGSGDPLNPASFSATFDRLVQASGLPTIGVRDLRHTYAELAVKAGVPIEVVSQRLGHATVTITVDMYGEGVPLVAA